MLGFCIYITSHKLTVGYFVFIFQGSSSKKKDSISIPVETKYKNQYEQKIDPFTSFSNQEKSRK